MSKPKRVSPSNGPAGARTTPAGRPPPSAHPLRLEYVEATTLTDNPANWRRHPDSQLAALRSVLADPEVGWAGALLFNERTGRLIDGHARKSVADPGQLVPVLIGSWSEEAERKILATLDPIGAAAQSDDEALARLLEGLQLDAACAALFAQVEAEAADAKHVEFDASPQLDDGLTYSVIVKARDEAHQRELIERFEGEGFECKPLIS